MAKADLILLHPPRVYDFRKLPILYGPDSDIIFSSSMYEMYPIGFMTISEYLRRHGLTVRIVNLAVKMLGDKNFDIEKLVKSLNPVAFGIDLHWLPHAQGALEIAKLCKKCHPEIPIIFGGLSASYFHQELITYPQVDYVVRGDSTEEPLWRLILAIKQKDPVKEIPNLTWKKGGNHLTGEIKVNPLTYVPGNLDNINFDYRTMMELSLSFRDLSGYRPFLNWFSYPVTGIFTLRGCLNNCLTCGGSRKAFKEICNREKPAYRSPELVVQDIFLTAEYIRAPLMVVGDFWQGGEDYAYRLVDLLSKKKIDNHLLFEFFSPPEKKFLKRLIEVCPNISFQISPESSEETIRYAFGRNYDNNALEQFIQNSLDFGAQRVDLFFLAGLPKQNKDSVFQIVDYSRYLLEKFGFRKKLHSFIAPLAPFVDPGSIAFENPDTCGYKFFYRTLEEHRQALLKPSLKYTLNYETRWMNREEIVSSTLQAETKLNRLKLKYGIVEEKFVQRREKRIENMLKLTEKIDTFLEKSDYLASDHLTDTNWSTLSQEIQWMNRGLIYRKEEIEYSKKFIHFNLPKIMSILFASGVSEKTNPALSGNHLLSDKEMRFTEHLEELRRRIISAVVTLVLTCVVSFFICYNYRKEILNILIKPVGKLHFLSPTEAFMAYLKISLIAGLLVALPVVLYQVWFFVAPGLKQKERKYVFTFLPVVFFLFLCGASFAYFVLIPVGVKFLLSLATPDLLPMITVDRYLSFVFMLMLGCGIIFEIPVLVFFLTKLGLVSAEMLIKKWKYIVLSIFIISAIVTPTPDVFNQIILAIPMFLLYGISIWVSLLARRKE